MLRALQPPEQRAIVARLEAACSGASPRRARRQADIVRRHVFGGAPARELSAELGISLQQFYADRSDAIRRIGTVTPAVPRSAPDGDAAAPHALVVHARALFEAGSSRRAGDLVDAIPLRELPASERLEATVLACDAALDVGDGARVASIDESCRGWLGATGESRAVESDYAVAAAGWVAMRRPNGPFPSADALDRVASAYRRLDAAGERAALPMLVRYLSESVPDLIQIGRIAEAERAIDDATAIARTRDDLPAATLAMLHVNRGYALTSNPHFLGAARAARSAAMQLARDNALLRPLWVCSSLAVLDRIVARDPAGALAQATVLSSSVAAGDSAVWRRYANSRLSNAYSANGMIDAAERCVEEIGALDPSDPAYQLQHCALLFRRGRYRETLERATALGRALEALPSYRANALLFAAAAAHRMDLRPLAVAAIEEVLAEYETGFTPLLTLRVMAYRLGFAITGRARYDAIAREADAALDASVGSSLPDAVFDALTPRQRQVAELAASGATNRAIAMRLGISVRTAGNHLNAAFGTLGIRARWQLVEALRDPHEPSPGARS